MTYYQVRCNGHVEKFLCPDQAYFYASVLIGEGCRPHLSVEQG